MKRLAIALVAVLAFGSGAALAALTGSMQHAWKVTHDDGSSFVVTYKDDGTYTTDSGIKGTWKLQLCVKRSTGEANCMDAKLDAKPGDTWKSEDAAKKPVTITVLQ